MEFTFGIITGGGQEAFINKIIDSIEAEQIPTYEVVIIGQCAIQRAHTTIILFPEHIRPMWITKKKNLISHVAKYENIVFLHDYVRLRPGWYQGFLQFGNEGWDVAMCKMREINGKRAIDWMGLPNDPIYGNVLHPYDYCNPKGMYVPGNFFVAKQSLMKEHPLDENRGWCEAEDIEWSKRIFGGADKSEWLRKILRIHVDIDVPDPEKPARYKMNTFSEVEFLKEKPTHINYYDLYDLNSGENSRPKGYKVEEYQYMLVRMRKEMEKRLEAYLDI